MWGWIDRLGIVVVNASVSAFALLALLGLGLIVCRQPVRRLKLTRAAVFGLLALIPLELGELLPKVEIGDVPQLTGLSKHPLWTWAEAVETVRAEGVEMVKPGRPIFRWLFLSYAVGLLGSLGWLALGYLMLSRLASRSVPASDESLALLNQLLGTTNGRVPRLAVATRLRRPILMGWKRPLILIPPELDEPEARDQLRLSLLHELAHLEARDPLYVLIGGLAQSFWFFLPPIWWVLAQMRLDQEFVADKRASTGFGPVRAYASSLLGLASGAAEALPETQETSLNESREPSNLEGSPSPLVLRLWMLLRNPVPVEAAPPGWWSWTARALGVLATLAASSLSLVPAELLDAPPAYVAKGTPPIRGTHSFVMEELHLSASPARPNGRAPRVELPIALPAKFDLSLEILATPLTLGRMHIAGLQLVLPHPIAGQNATSDWHKVVVRRDSDGLELLIDQVSLPILRADPTPLRLTIEPAPGLEVQIRNLTLLW